MMLEDSYGYDCALVCPEPSLLPLAVLYNLLERVAENAERDAPWSVWLVQAKLERSFAHLSPMAWFRAEV
ncbi:hypothetical protein [Sorangium sp. So ce1078]|uniref:hypothetical protein n=1 Tax=Sorangium sp. So ce1078 TaxID=3133329 RepID=UPI003F60D77B